MIQHEKSQRRTQEPQLHSKMAKQWCNQEQPIFVMFIIIILNSAKISQNYPNNNSYWTVTIIFYWTVTIIWVQKLQINSALALSGKPLDYKWKTPCLALPKFANFVTQQTFAHLACDDNAVWTVTDQWWLEYLLAFLNHKCNNLWTYYKWVFIFLDKFCTTEIQRMDTVWHFPVKNNH